MSKVWLQQLKRKGKYRKKEATPICSELFNVGNYWDKCAKRTNVHSSEICPTVSLVDPIRFHPLWIWSSFFWRSQIFSFLVSLNAPFHLKLLLLSMRATMSENLGEKRVSGQHTYCEGGDTGGFLLAIWMVSALLQAPTPVWQACHESSTADVTTG